MYLRNLKFNLETCTINVVYDSNNSGEFVVMDKLIMSQEDFNYQQ